MLNRGYRPSPWTTYYIAQHVRENSADVISIMIQQHLLNTTPGNGPRAFETDWLLAHAVRNYWNATLVIDAIVDSGLSVAVTPRIVRRMSGYGGYRDALVSLLQRQQSQSIAEDTLAVIAANHCPDAMELALDRAADAAITTRVALALIKNSSCGADIFCKLLDRARRGQLEITAMLLHQASHRDDGGEILSLLVRRGGEKISITLDLCESAAEHCNGETMNLLIDRGNSLPISESVALSAARNKNHGAEVMRILLDYDLRDFEITSSLLEKACFNYNCLPQLMTILINQTRASEVVFTKLAIMGMAQDMDKAVTVMGILARAEVEVHFVDDAVEEAMKSLSAPAVAPLLSHLSRCSKKVPEIAVHAAAAWSGQYGNDVVRLLLDHLGEDFPATELIIEAIAKNLDGQVMKRLLDLHGRSIHSTPELICEIANNEHYALEVLDVLLQYTEADVTINDDAIVNAAANTLNGTALIRHFLSLESARLEITETAVAAVARASDAPMLRLMLDSWRRDGQLPETVLENAVQNKQHGTDLVQLLLAWYGPEIQFTSDVVNLAAGNEACGDGVMTLLLDHTKFLPLTSNTINVAAANKSCGRSLMSLFLDYNKDLVLTDTTMVNIAANPVAALAIFELLFERRPHNFPVRTTVLKEVASNEDHGLAIMEKLLDKRRNDIRITPEVLVCAAGNPKCGPAMTRLLLKCPHSFQSLLTEDVLIAAVSNSQDSQEEVLTALLKHQQWDCIPLTTRVLEAMCSPAKLTALLRLSPPELPFTEAMVLAVMGSYNDPEKRTTCLMAYRGTDIPLTKQLLLALLDRRYNHEVVRFLLRRRAEDFPVADDVLESIVHACDADIVACFLDLKGEPIQVTQGHLQAAIRNWNHGPEILEVLLEHQGDILLTEEVVLDAATESINGLEVLEILFKRYGDKVPVTDKVIAAAVQASCFTGEGNLCLLLKHGGQGISLTAEIVRNVFWSDTKRRRVLSPLFRGVGRITEGAACALMRDFGPEDVSRVLDECGERVPVTPMVIQAATENRQEHRDAIIRMLLSRGFDWVANKEIHLTILRHCTAEIAGLLLGGTDITMNEETVLALIAEAHESVVQLLITLPSGQIPLGPHAVQAIAGRLSGETMSMLLARRGGSVVITKQVVTAALEENFYYGQDVVSVLLDERADELNIDDAMFVQMVERFDAGTIHRLSALMGPSRPMTSSLLHATLANSAHGDQVLKTLISKSTSIDPQALIKLVEQVDPEMMQSVLQKQAQQLLITEEIAREYTFCQELMSLLLQQRSLYVPLTESVLVAIFGRFDSTVINTLLDQLGGGIDLTEAVTMSVLDGPECRVVMKLLLDRRAEDIPVTEPILMAMANRLDAPTITLLLDKSTGDLAITEGVIAAARENYDHDEEVVPVLLGRCSEGKQISEATFSYCVERYDDNFIRHLLERHGTGITVTESLVTAVNRNENFGEEVIKTILTNNEPTFGEDAVVAIVRHFGPEVLDILLNVDDGSLLMDKDVWEAAASNLSHGAEVVGRLLQSATDFPISRHVVRAAAWNDPSGASIMDLLLEERGQLIQLTQDVLLAAVRSTDGVLLRAVLKHRKHEIPITATLVKHCTESSIMTLMLRRDHFSFITAHAVVEVARRFDAQIMAALVRVHGPGLPMTEDVVIAAGMNKARGCELMSLLIDSPGLNAPFTNHVLESIIRRSEIATEMMDLLLQQRSETVLTEEMVRLAAAHEKSGTELIKLFFSHLGKQLPITENVVKAATANDYQGLKILEYLLAHWGPKLPITEKVVIAALRNMYCQEIIDLLQEKQSVPVTPRVIEIAAASVTKATSLVKTLLPLHGAENLITSAVVSAAIQHWNEVDSLLSLLVGVGGSGSRVIATERTVEEAAHAGYKATAALLPFVPDNIRISESTMKGIVKYDEAGAPLTRMALDRAGKCIPFTAAVVRAASCNINGPEIFKLLVQHCRESLLITEDLVIETAKGFDGNLITLLLDRQDVGPCVTSSVIEAALENRVSALDVLEALARLDIKIMVTEKILQDVVQNPKSQEDVTSFLLRQGSGKVPITEGVVRAAVSNEEVAGIMVKLILDHTTGDMPLNEDIMTAAVSNENCGKHIVDLLFGMDSAQAIPITRSVINAAAGNRTSGTDILARCFEHKWEGYILTPDILVTAARNTRLSKEIVELILNHEPSIPVTVDALNAAFENRYAGEELFTLLLGCPGLNVPITSKLLEAAAGVSAEATKALLNQHGNNVKITEPIMKMAAGNSDSGAELLGFFLDEHDASDAITEAVCKAAAANTGYDQGPVIISMLLSHGGKDIVTAGVVQAAVANNNQRVLDLLLYELGEGLPLSAGVFKAAMESVYAIDILKKLLPYAEHNDSLLKQVAGSATLGTYGREEKLKFFLDQWGRDFSVTEEIVKEVVTAGLSSEKMLSTVFDCRGRDLLVTEEVVIAAAEAGYYAKYLMPNLLIERGDALSITPRILEAAIRNTDCGLELLSLLFSERGDEIPFCEKAMKAATELSDRTVLFFLENHWQVYS
ncbi:hypothetical protein BJX65DRAFT_223896 [Aspergillus insuetus]